ncbi:MAG: indolepyruvate oxidoreductase subunit beta [Dehalococcoidia bacterium]|nr:indolepyruvate oxidoreductase subunit beta [Dehalococcoidia bacterium]
MKKLDLLITGIGGQGVILASDIISEAAVSAGYDVKKTDTLGMAQRGGSVISHVRIARQVFSPLIRAGEVDILLAFEKLEAARWSYYLSPGGTAIINDQAVPPLSVSTGSEQYPSDEEITGLLKFKTGRIYFVDGVARAEEIGNVRTVNTFMLGCTSVFIPFENEIWKDSLSRHLPPKLMEINLRAFEKGREVMSHVRQ